MIRPIIPPLVPATPPHIANTDHRRIDYDQLLDKPNISALSASVSVISIAVSAVAGDVASVEAHVNAVSNALSAASNFASAEDSLLSLRINSAEAVAFFDIDGGDADAVFGGLPAGIDGGGA